MDLVILAGGMGSRFGGLKQIESIDNNNNFIIDYSIFDAIKAGFERVVFIIKKENYDIFKTTIGSRIEDKIKVEYVFQQTQFLPNGVVLPADRIKPLGTAHAILCCSQVVKSNFLVINADDFYGRDAFMVASEFLKQNKDDNMYGLVAYKVKNTLTENGSVKRGVCFAKGGYLSNITECLVEQSNGKIIAKPLNNSPEILINDQDIASMNMFAFSPNIFEYLKQDFEKFIKNPNLDMLKCEYLIGEVVDELIKSNEIKTKILNTSAKWRGVTYKEDKPNVVRDIQKMKDNGEYPQNLWE